MVVTYHSLLGQSKPLTDDGRIFFSYRAQRSIVEATNEPISLFLQQLYSLSIYTDDSAMPADRDDTWDMVSKQGRQR
jgi:hypothetical protein